MQEFDIIIIGAGASGMFAAGRAMRAKKSVCILDMGLTPARRVAVSGGGKCNFTNMRADIRDTELKQFAFHIQNIKLNHDDFSLFGFAGAEVTRGGISTSQISSKTMESKLCPGLYFIGECVDIAGDLGGYNLHWAWASANAVEI